jgi:hypothetical protein
MRPEARAYVTALNSCGGHNTPQVFKGLVEWRGYAELR